MTWWDDAWLVWSQFVSLYGYYFLFFCITLALTVASAVWTAYRIGEAPPVVALLFSIVLLVAVSASWAYDRFYLDYIVYTGRLIWYYVAGGT